MADVARTTETMTLTAEYKPDKVSVDCRINEGICDLTNKHSYSSYRKNLITD